MERLLLMNGVIGVDTQLHMRGSFKLNEDSDRFAPLVFQPTLKPMRANEMMFRGSLECEPQKSLKSRQPAFPQGSGPGFLQLKWRLKIETTE